MICELLRLSGAYAECATSGAEALEKIATHDFDVVLSDISMPEMDGFELLGRIRELPHTDGLPAVAMTGFGRAEDVERASAAGFLSHLTKPVDAAALIKTLQTIPRRVVNNSAK